MHHVSPDQDVAELTSKGADVGDCIGKVLVDSSVDCRLGRFASIQKYVNQKFYLRCCIAAEAKALGQRLPCHARQPTCSTQAPLASSRR